ncbi:MAG: argininosuccinate lyase [Spirochaetes bacterium]|nr:argininosuccinate lyase [Spirochaetota bacterium]
MKNKKAWSGRFREEMDPLFEKMNQSLSFDIRLYKQDILLNKVYSNELNKLGIISDEDLNKIIEGLDVLEKDIEKKGISIFTDEIEDIHMGIETLLVKKIGESAKRIHAGKSRNDQIATDIRIYLIDEIKEISILLKNFLESIVFVAENNLDIIMPGYTHLRHAQPLLFSHYIMSFFFSLERDYERLADSLKRISIMPLGSAALSGSGFNLNREKLRKDLGFKYISKNSIDAVLSRDFILEFLSNISIMSITLSRFAEDFILYSSEHFNFFILSDKITTGSSIMPNKKNPDSLELTRAKTGRILGNFVALFTVLKSLPSTYNKDLQEDKERLFDTIDTIKDVLKVNKIVLDYLELNKTIMKNSIDTLSFATELVDYLTLKNVPFREAHHIVGKIVMNCVENQFYLTSLTEKMLVSYDKNFKGIKDDWANIETFLKRRELEGGTGLNSVKKQIDYAKKKLTNNFTI